MAHSTPDMQAAMPKEVWKDIHSRMSQGRDMRRFIGWNLPRAAAESKATEAIKNSKGNKDTFNVPSLIDDACSWQPSQDKATMLDGFAVFSFFCLAKIGRAGGENVTEEIWWAEKDF